MPFFVVCVGQYAVEVKDCHKLGKNQVESVYSFMCCPVWVRGNYVYAIYFLC